MIIAIEVDYSGALDTSANLWIFITRMLKLYITMIANEPLSRARNKTFCLSKIQLTITDS